MLLSTGSFFRNGASGGGAGADPYFSSVKLLIGPEGADGSTSITDESSNHRTVNVFGNAQVDTGIAPPFGTTSLLLDGTGDYLQVADDADFDYGTGDFTLEVFVRPAVTANSNYVLVQAGASGNIAFTWRVNASNQTDVVYSVDGTATFNLASTSGDVPINTWTHLCFERSGNKLRLYVAGTMKTSSTTIGSNALFNTSAAPTIGMRSTSTTTGFNGNMKELRITKGVARYNTDTSFTVPTDSFPRS